MKKVIIALIIVASLFITTGCNDKNIEKSNTNEKASDEKVNNIKLTINNKTYNLILEDNNTVIEFINLLPQEYNMNELNGNEKYIYINSSLTTNSYNPKHIEKGDVMLYGDNCLVIFYKSFDTSYSYTKIGHIENLDDLGNGKIKDKFEKQ